MTIEKLRREALRMIFLNREANSAVVFSADVKEARVPHPHEAEFPIRPYASASRSSGGLDVAAWAFTRILDDGEKREVERLFPDHQAEWVDAPAAYRPN